MTYHPVITFVIIVGSKDMSRGQVSCRVLAIPRRAQGCGCSNWVIVQLPSRVLATCFGVPPFQSIETIFQISTRFSSCELFQFAGRETVKILCFLPRNMIFVGYLYRRSRTLLDSVWPYLATYAEVHRSNSAISRLKVSVFKKPAEFFCQQCHLRKRAWCRLQDIDCDIL